MGVVRLRSGRHVTIRPIRPDDGDALRAAYDQLSPASQYSRFLAPKPHLSVAETRYLVDTDGADHQAYVATLPRRPETIIGVARFVRLPEEPQVAEIAVVVGDMYHGEGIATALLERLASAAIASGIVRFRATMLADNTRARALMRQVAGRPGVERSIGHIREIEVAVGPG
jgi:acetyltransferase